MPRPNAPKFTPGQAVVLRFDSGETLDAEVIENIDASCHPLTDWWLVRVIEDGRPWTRPFGFSGKSIAAREVA